MTLAEMKAKAEELRELKVMAEELTAEITAIEDELKSELVGRDLEEINAGGYKIRYKIVTSNRFDSAAFKREMPELYATYSKSTTSRRFSVA